MRTLKDKYGQLGAIEVTVERIVARKQCTPRRPKEYCEPESINKVPEKALKGRPLEVVMS